MNDRVPLFKRAYEGVKAKVTRGLFRPGERVDAKSLAADHFTSLTPIRASLHQMVGEGMLEAHLNDGFHVPLITEPRLRDLQQWNLVQLDAALATALRGRYAGGAPSPPRARIKRSEDLVEDTERLFLAIAGVADNSYAMWTVRLFNDHLRAVRLLEPQLMDDLDQELDAAIDLFTQGDLAALSRAIHAYHDRRRQHVTALIALLLRPRDEEKDVAPAA